MHDAWQENEGFARASCRARRNRRNRRNKAAAYAKQAGTYGPPSHPAPFRAVASLGKSPGLRGFESSVKDSKEGTPRGGAIAGTNGGKASMGQDRTTRRICIAPEH